MQDLLASVYEGLNVRLVHFPPKEPTEFYNLAGTVSGLDQHRRVTASVLYAAQEAEKAAEEQTAP